MHNFLNSCRLCNCLVGKLSCWIKVEDLSVEKIVLSSGKDDGKRPKKDKANWKIHLLSKPFSFCSQLQQHVWNGLQSSRLDT